MKLAKNFDVPADIVTKAVGVMGVRGSGKSYTDTRLFELLHAEGAQQIAIDPTGVWWGLRLAANGKDAGLDVPVLGGLHGDIPLEPDAGALVARMLVETGSSAILDVNLMTKAGERRFATDFAEALFLEKKRAKVRTPLMVHVEEAQVFVPQRVPRGGERMLGAFESLVKLGRNFGIGVSLVSQRPQSVNKDALNQVEVLICMQINGSQERKAIREWVVDNVGDGPDLMRRLPELRTGEAVFWSPSWLRELREIQVSKKWTYDASATPTLGKRSKAVEPKPLDLGALQDAMAEVVERATQDDPKVLRARIVELERELAQRPERVVHVGPGEDSIGSALRGRVLEALRALVSEFEAAGEAGGASDVPSALTSSKRRCAAPRAAAAAPPQATRPKRVAAPVAGSVKLSKGERAVLTALAQLQPRPLSKRQLALTSGYSPKSSTMRNILSSCRTAAFITDLGDGSIAITTEGLGAVGGVEPLDADARRLLWISKLGAGPRAFMEALIEAWPNALSRDQLEERTGYSQGSSTFRNNLSALRAPELVVVAGDMVTASDELFPDRAGAAR